MTTRSDTATKDAAARAIAKALGSAHAAYWAACDAEGRAIDPAALGATHGLLDDAFDNARSVEAFARTNGISWSDARDRF